MSGEISWADSIYAEGWDPETSDVGIALFGNAVQVWAIFQGREVTISQASLHFNCSPERVREAVEYHYWMFIGPGDIIEHEGE